MENFLCENPMLLQDGAGFGIKGWILPFLTLFAGLIFLVSGRIIPKELHREFFPKYLRYVFPLAILYFVISSYGILKDRAEKSEALEAGDYTTLVGNILDVQTRTGVYSIGLLVRNIRLTMEGHMLYADGRVFELDGKNTFSQFWTEVGSLGTGGKTCSGRKCGLEVNDRVRVKVGALRKGVITDTLSIEKCQK
jgi:hypothetical protein